MPFRPIRDEEQRRIRFLFDSEQGVIRHKSRGGKEQDYRIVEADGQYNLEPVTSGDYLPAKQPFGGG